MTNLEFICFLYVITILLLFQVASGVDYDFMFFCPNSTHYKTNEPFDRNLEKLMKHLSSHTPHQGFSIGSFGEDKDLAYGHALCIASLSPVVCKDCVTKASRFMRTVCPSSKDAIIGALDCMLKYSNSDLYGQIDIRSPLVKSTKKLVDNPKLYHNKLIDMMHQLVEQASQNQKMHAVGKSEVDEKRQLFGFVQCTPDLLPSDCEECLNELIKLLSKPDKVTSAVNIISGSCILKFAISRLSED